MPIQGIIVQTKYILVRISISKLKIHNLSMEIGWIKALASSLQVQIAKAMRLLKFYSTIYFSLNLAVIIHYFIVLINFLNLFLNFILNFLQSFYLFIINFFIYF